MFHLVKPGTNYDFVGKRYLWAGLSIACILGSLVLLLTKGLNYGIDFVGGAEVHIKAPATWDTEKLRTVLGESATLKGIRVQNVGEASSHEFLVRAQGDEHSINQVSAEVKALLTKNSSDSSFEILKSDVVGPAAGSALRQQGFMATLYVLIVIFLYVSLRFDSRYAPGAVLALFHDTMIVLGIYVIMQRPFDLTILGALLALIGYSNNDTIIVFDRVREESQLHPEWSIEKLVNSAVNDTLGRTLMTSLTTFLVAFSLWMWGGPVLENFAFMYMVGIVVGSYSSIFIASSLVIFLTHWQQRRKNASHGGGGGKKKRKVYQVRPEPSERAG